MFNSFVLPDKIQNSSKKNDKIKHQIKNKNKIVPNSEKKMRFPLPLSEIERHTAFVNTNYHQNNEEQKICTIMK
jgi:hypothetical protein